MATTTTPTPAPAPTAPKPAPVEKPKEHDPANELSPPYDPAKDPGYKPAPYKSDDKGVSDTPRPAEPAKTGS